MEEAEKKLNIEKNFCGNFRSSRKRNANKQLIHKTWKWAIIYNKNFIIMLISKSHIYIFFLNIAQRGATGGGGGEEGGGGVLN